VSGNTVKYDGNIISSLTKNSDSTAKDALLLKLDSSGNYQWGVRLGGIGDEEITSVIETSQKNIVIVGEYNSRIFNFYNKDTSTVRDTINNSSNINGFIASYSFNGDYQWSQGIRSENSNVLVSDVAEYSDGLLVSLNNYNGIIYPTLTTQSRLALFSGVVEYSLEGNYRDIFKSIGTNYYNRGRIESIDIAKDNSIIAGINIGNYDSYIYKINIDGKNIQEQILYSLTGSLSEFVSDVKVTSDNGILFGGWYYSNDINGEGLTEKYALDGTPNNLTSYGYIIKLDSNYKVEYSSMLKGENVNGINSVTETEDGRWVAGGFFSSNTLTATHLYATPVSRFTNPNLLDIIFATVPFPLPAGPSIATIILLSSYFLKSYLVYLYVLQQFQLLLHTLLLNSLSLFLHLFLIYLEFQLY